MVGKKVSSTKVMLEGEAKLNKSREELMEFSQPLIDATWTTRPGLRGNAAEGCGEADFRTFQDGSYLNHQKLKSAGWTA